MTLGSLTTLTEDGDPWPSLVVYGPKDDGNPVLLVSTMAEHRRNLADDPRASLAIKRSVGAGEPLDPPRITLAGRALRPEGEAAEAALDAHVAAIPGAPAYAGWDDFSLWVLEVQRVRWVGGFARSTPSAPTSTAGRGRPDAADRAKAAEHLNKSHTEGLLRDRPRAGRRARRRRAVLTGIDRYDIDLSCTAPVKSAAARVEFDAPLTKAADVRPASRPRAARTGAGSGTRRSLSKKSSSRGRGLLRLRESPHKFLAMQPALPSNLRGAHNHGWTTPTIEDFPDRLLGPEPVCPGRAPAGTSPG